MEIAQCQIIKLTHCVLLFELSTIVAISKDHKTKDHKNRYVQPFQSLLAAPPRRQRNLSMADFSSQEVARTGSPKSEVIPITFLNYDKTAQLREHKLFNRPASEVSFFHAMQHESTMSS